MPVIIPSSGSALASAYAALCAQERQAGDTDPFGHALVALTRRLQSLARRRLESDAGAAPPSSAASQRAVASLVRRIRSLRAVLLRLARIDPGSAHRLAPELRTLHRLLTALLRREHLVRALQSRPAAGGGAIDISGPTGAGAPYGQAADPPAAPPGGLDASPDTARQSMAGTPAPALDAPPRISSRTHSAATSAAPRPEPFLTTLQVSTGPSRSVSATAAPTGAAAGALVTLCGMRLATGVVCSRLTLTVRPRRLNVRRHRLERPG
jgi:hypothetical protein